MKKEVLQRLFSRKAALLSCLVLLLYLAGGIAVEIHSFSCRSKGIQPVYLRTDETRTCEPPSLQHWGGTDYLGRDVFLRGVASIRTALKVGIISSLVSMILGVGLGVAAGFRGGKTDTAVVWIYSTFASMPSLLFILAFSLLVTKGFISPGLKKGFDLMANLLLTEPGMLAVYLGIGLTGWVSLCRVVRAEAMRLREQNYVQAARVLGVRESRIVFRHILPNISHIIIIYFTMQFASAVMAEVIVSYLGLGVQFEPSWGIMISDGQEKLWRGMWWEAAFATGFIFFLVLSLNVLGDAIRDVTDPRLKNV